MTDQQPARRKRPPSIVTMDLQQIRAGSWRGTDYDLVVNNPNERDVEVVIDATDARRLCVFKLPQVIVIPAGDTVVRRVKVSPARRRFFGPAGVIAFTITGHPSDGRPIQVHGRMPDRALGVAPLLGMVAALALLIGGGVTAGLALSGDDDEPAAATGEQTETPSSEPSTEPTSVPSNTASTPEPTQAAAATPTPVPATTEATATPTRTATATTAPSPTPTPTPTQPPPTGGGDATFTPTLFCTESGCTGPGGSLVSPLECVAGIVQTYANYTLAAPPGEATVRLRGPGGVVAELQLALGATGGSTLAELRGAFPGGTYTAEWGLTGGPVLGSATLVLTCP